MNQLVEQSGKKAKGPTPLLMSTDKFAHQAAVLVLGGLSGKFLTATAAQEAPVQPSGVCGCNCSHQTTGAVIMSTGWDVLS